MSTQAAPATAAPSGQVDLPLTPPAAGGTAGPADSTIKADVKPAKEAAPTASILGAAGAPPDADKVGEKADGEATRQAGESKDTKPEAGDVEIKLPEGVQADPESIKAFAAVAKEHGLTSEVASKLAAWNVQRLEGESKAQREAWAKQGEAWRGELQKDPDFGGANLAESETAVRRAWARFGDAATASELDAMGLGNHPGLVKLMARIGRAIKEDDASIPPGGPTAPADDRESALRADYPSMYDKDGKDIYKR